MFPSFICRVGQARYARRRWFLSAGQKKRVRTRLREVDELIETLKASNITTPKLEEALKLRKESELTPTEKYYVFSKNPKYHMKPIIQVPHFTKVPHPRGFPSAYAHLANRKIK
ncbi:hypothetical protein MP638_001677 [Amoeboaphelidium occidentale]|nr:hypothetical protein MP638_001677 [Amoeboaphelidium occidentale]